MTKQAMQEPTFLILTALADRAQHGYGIMTDVAGISQGRVELRAGTLYAALDRLLGDGIVGVDREEVVDGRLRRYYRPTPPGAELLAAQAARAQRQRPAAAACGPGCGPGRGRHLAVSPPGSHDAPPQLGPVGQGDSKRAKLRQAVQLSGTSTATSCFG